ncbi:MAG: hypothetical protein ACRDQA_17425 [Nocardioidaceae bacterium]
MPKRKQRRKGRQPHQVRDIERHPAQEEPDLLQDVAKALTGDPIDLLAMVSSTLVALEPKRSGPFAPEPEMPPISRDELVEALLGVELVETSALLTTIGELTGDEVLRRRIGREVAARGHPLPKWLVDLGSATVDRVVQLSHVLGDGDNVIAEVRLPDDFTMSMVIYVDHNRLIPIEGVVRQG